MSEPQPSTLDEFHARNPFRVVVRLPGRARDTITFWRPTANDGVISMNETVANLAEGTVVVFCPDGSPLALDSTWLR